MVSTARQTSKESQREEDGAAVNRYVTFADRSATAGHPTAIARGFLGVCKDASAEACDVKRLEETATTLLTELTAHRLWLDRISLEAQVAVADKNAYAQMQQRLEADIQSVRAEAEDLRGKVEESKIFRQRQQEYEALRKLVVQLPSRTDTQSQIDAVQAEIADCQAEAARLDNQLEFRKKQFTLLAHVLRDLKSSFQDEPHLNLETEQEEGEAKMDTDE